MKDRERTPLGALASGFRKRTLVTVKVLANLGLGMARRNLGMQQAVDEISPQKEEQLVASALSLVEQLDGLKGLTMKLGQMMSYLDQSVPERVRKVLARLQSQARPVDGAAIAAVVKAELGKPPEELFDRWEARPFAAASLGQVHRATLAGQDYAVKVQYPGVEQLLRADIGTVGKLARFATMLSPMDGKGLVDELAARVIEECDYEAEARNQELRRLLADHDGIQVPAVRRDRSSRRVLTSELAPRRSFEAFVAAAPAAVRDRAGSVLYDACFTTIFHHCVYNANPHPGNYLFSDEGDVTLLDFGCVKRFSADFIDGWKRIALAVLDDDLAAFQRAWTDAGFVGRKRGFDFAHQLAAMRFLYTPMITRGPFRFSHEFVAQVHDHTIFRNANKLKLALPPDWLFVNRLQLGLFSILAALGSTAPYHEMFRKAIESPTVPAA